MRTILALSFLSSLLFLNTGCMTAAKRVLKEGKGASSKAEPVPGTAGGSFARYKSVQIVPPRTNLGGLVSSEFKSHLVTAMREELVNDEDAMFKGGSPTLTIEPEIMWYHRGGIGGVMPEKFVVALFWLKEGNSEVGRVQIVTKSEATRTGDDDLAESMAAGLAKFFGKVTKEEAKEKEKAAS